MVRLRSLFVLLVLCCWPSLSQSNDRIVVAFRDGYASYGGDLWYRGGQAYTYLPGTRYYSNGCYYWTPGTYTPYYPPVLSAPADTSYALPKPPVYGPKWKEQALKYAEARDDVASYLKTLEALGLRGQQFLPSGYAPDLIQSYPYGRGSLSYGQFGYNGNTLYGYSVKDVLAIYGDLAPSVLFQQSARLASGSQAAASQANADFNTLVAQLGDNQSRVAEILARGAAARQVLEGTKTNEAKVLTRSFSTGPMPPASDPGPGLNPNAQAQPSGGQAAWQRLASERCAGCHSGAMPEAKFDIARYPELPPEEKARVWARLTATDASKRMPLGKDGRPGVALTADEMRLFFNN